MSRANQQIENELAMIRSKRAIDYALEGYRLTDMSGIILDANNAYSATTGYTIDELKGMHISQLAIKDSREEVSARLEKIKAKGQDRFESCHRHKDGHLIDVEVSASYLPETQQVFIFSRDITENKRQQRLFTQLMFALNKANEQVFQLDENARFLYVNDEVCNSLGYSREELLDGMSIFDISPSMTKERWVLHWQYLEENKSVTFESTQRARDGRETSVEIIANFSNLEESRFALGLVRDITERRGKEALLVQTMKKMEIAENERRQLLSVASHEFRTPAAIIKSSLDSLKILNLFLPNEVTQRLDNISKASNRLNRLANSLITYERINEHSLKPKIDSLDMGVLIRDVVSQYPKLDSLQVQIPDSPVTIKSDSLMIGIALQNLIDNALRFQSDFNSPIIVSLEESKKDDKCNIEIKVIDQGPGIPDSEKEEIFHRFFSTKKGHNNGLGLSIVLSIAHSLGGTAFALDNDPQGTIMVLRLPANYS